jgi:ATP-dependent RNA helicase RhlE
MNKILDIQLVEVLNQNGFTDLFELEKICMPKIKSGHDLLCVAENGCGKTVTIVLGVLQRLKKSLNDTPRALIIVPDIARATEMKNEFTHLGGYTDLRVNLACENEKIDDQKDRIYMGSDVVIGTTKRLNQIYSLYALDLSGIKIFAIDDAEDVVKSMNLSQVIRLSQGPSKTQYLVFAGKMTEWIERFSNKVMNVQEVIELDNDTLLED